MKSILKTLSIASLWLLAATGVVSPAFAAADSGSDNIGQVVDVTTTVGGNVKDCAESLHEFLSTTKDEEALEIVVNALAKAGLDKSWAKQIGSLKKFCGIAGKLLDAITIGNTIRELEQVWDDRQAFSEVFADHMTEYASDAVAGLVSAAVKTFGTGVIAGSTIVAPGLGTIIATGGVWLISWGAGELAGWAFEKLAGTDLIRHGMEELGGAIWDLFHRTVAEESEDNPGDGHPGFNTMPDDSAPNDSDRDSRYQGLKPIKLL